MKLTKPALIKAVDPYIKKRYGEIVIERDNVEKLQEVLSQTFDNIGFEVRDGARSEKLVILSLSKGGIRQFLDIPIVASELHTDSPWNVEEVVHQLILLSDQYGYDVFRDNKRAAALMGDVLVKYSNECKIMKLLFQQGLGEALGPIPYTSDRDLQNASYRIELLMQSLGMGQNTIANIKTVVRRVFVSHAKYSAEKEKNSRIQSSDFDSVQRDPAPTRPQIPKTVARTRAGRVYTVAMTGSGLAEMCQIDVITTPGTGIFDSDLEVNRNQISLAFEDMRENQFYGFRPYQVLGTNYQFSCKTLSGKSNSSCSSLSFMLAMCSALKNKPIIDDMVIIGDIHRSGSIISPAEWEAILTCCHSCGKQKLLVPFLSVRNLIKVAPALLHGIEFEQYYGTKEALKETLDIK